MAMRLPVNREVALAPRLPEGLKAHLLVIFEGRGLPRHHAARKDDVAVIGAGGPGQPDQRILAGPAGTDHQDEATWSDRRQPMTCYGRSFGHATRRPSRQTLRTTGTSRATCTRIRSARLPAAISPRSARPTASAGVLVTVRIADARSMAGTRCGNCSAAISRLDGM